MGFPVTDRCPMSGSMVKVQRTHHSFALRPFIFAGFQATRRLSSFSPNTSIDCSRISPSPISKPIVSCFTFLASWLMMRAAVASAAMMSVLAMIAHEPRRSFMSTVVPP